MKKLLAFTVVMFFFSSSFAQLAEMQIVGKPQKLDNEFVGVRDANGRICAALQVISDQEGFRYQSYNGVVKVDDEPGKDMVYLQPDERVVEIFLPDHKPLKIILSDIGIQLHEKEVWKIEIEGTARSIGLLPVTILVQPSDAYVTVNGNRVISGQPVQLSKGSHRLRISKEGYQTREETINVSESQVLFNFSLSEVPLEAVVIKSIPGEAQVFLDGTDRGNTGQDGRPLFLYPGTYQLKVQKSGYVEVNQTLTVVTGGNNTFTFNLEKNSGTLELAVQPADATVLVNRENYSGRTRIELPPGQYKIEVSKNGYHSQSETVKLARGETLRKNYNLDAITGRLQFTVQPLSARVTLKRSGRTIESWTGMKMLNALPVGEYELEVSADGYAKQTKRITISEGQSLPVDIQLSRAVVQPSRPSATMDAAGIEMVFVKGGTFTMGDTWGDGESDEKPTHRVTLNSFYISKYEVTQAQYREVMGRNPSSFSGDNRPVEQVSWYDAVTFCNELSRREGLTPCYVIDGTNTTCNFNANGYRLPTEAEWEYAAKGGANGNYTKYSGSNTADDVAWYYDNSGLKTHTVGIKQANELGLYDMSGNVWEWCWDWYSGSYYSISPSSNPTGPSSGSTRVLRGGSWLDDANDTRVANRNLLNPFIANINFGFRISRTYP